MTGEKITSRWLQHRHANCFQLIALFCLIFIKRVAVYLLIYSQEAADRFHQRRKEERQLMFSLGWVSKVLDKPWSGPWAQSSSDARPLMCRVLPQVEATASDWDVSRRSHAAPTSEPSTKEQRWSDDMTEDGKKKIDKWLWISLGDK